MVPVWKLLQAAYGSAGEPGETAARQMRIFKELVASSSPVGRMVSGRSSVHVRGREEKGERGYCRRDTFSPGWVFASLSRVLYFEAGEGYA